MVTEAPTLSFLAKPFRVLFALIFKAPRFDIDDELIMVGRERISVGSVVNVSETDPFVAAVTSLVRPGQANSIVDVQFAGCCDTEDAPSR